MISSQPTGQVAEIGDKFTGDSDQLGKWMEGNKFKLNAGKTHFMIMGTSARLQITDKFSVTMDGVELKESLENKETLLGVTMQCNLKWSFQIEDLTSKLKTRLTGLDKIKHIMSKSKKKNIVQGVFNSVLCYCLPLFGGCNKSEMSSLQVQQNKAAQIVLNFPPRTNMGLMFDQLEWLTVHQLIAYHTLISVYRIRSA